jgi:hypothetical protein
MGFSVLAWVVVLTGCEKVDGQTRVLARNVIVESSSRSSLTSGDAQDALETLTLDLGRVMIGTWNIVNKNIEDSHVASGRVQISAGGVFALEAGSFAAIGEGTGGFCDHVAGSETYEFLTPKLVVFRHVNQGTNNNVIPAVVDLQQDTITFMGSGGCGQLGLQRVSILTRRTPDAGP